MKSDLPTPEQILEELADKVAVQIDRLAPVAFDSALGELLRHHRFLLAISATGTPHGVPFNFAEVAGFAWRAPHEEWIAQYRRLFERATHVISEDPTFLAKLSRVPTRLLPGQDDQAYSEAVLRSILDLGPVLVHRLEAWVAKRMISESQDGQGLPRPNLVGSDLKIYEAVVADVVGAWESLLHVGVSLFHERATRRASNAERWAALTTSWPFAWRHLTNTAYLLAVAVWNEDEAGASLYRDSLVRWSQTLARSRNGRADLIARRLLFPDIAKLPWNEALEKLQPNLLDYIPQPSPDEVFNAMLRGAHDDVILITSALLLLWTMNDKQVADIGSRTASPLLRREPIDPDDREMRAQPRAFDSLFLDVLRIELAGERFDDEAYGATLDGIVAALDNMTERRVISGRIYTPSTLNDRGGLLQPIIAILLAALPTAGGDGGLLKRVEKLAANESALPDGDHSLRKLLHTLGRISTALESPTPQLQRGLATLNSDADFPASRERLSSIVAGVVETIQKERTARIQRRQPDPAKLEHLRATMEQAMLTPPAGVPFFRDFVIAAKTLPNVEPQSILLGGITKAQLLDPAMEAESSNMAEAYATFVQDSAGNRVWRQFCDRPRQIVTISAKIEDDAFWKSVGGLVSQVGPNPTLVVSRQAEGRAIRRFIYAKSNTNPTLKIEQKPSDDARGQYIATVEGVDVYGADFSPGSAWLFSARSLRSLAYAPVDGATRAVTLTFEPKDEITGSLRVAFRQLADWNDSPIFDLTIDDPDEGEEP